ncbi:hypothetical protein BDQ12DRAFT_774861 [Crucibulum laeve]|uniref:Uncharacterized protein n=1 Tax=Crucibulum laeve TaxID=68775 RepID=A0A5C3LH63_9AGAR|nr:hypothetical protein BDQ12DRAFT_774861 [Crucibulum laeve]
MSMHVWAMPKPFIHVTCPPLELALNVRRVRSEAKFVNSGCHSNVVQRLVLCKKMANDTWKEEHVQEDHRRALEGREGRIRRTRLRSVTSKSTRRSCWVGSGTTGMWSTTFPRI